MIPFLLTQSISKPPENRTTNPKFLRMVIQQQQLSRPNPLLLPVDARCAFRTIKVNLHSPL